MRSYKYHIFTFAAGSTTSSPCFLGGGAFGTLLVAADLDGKAVNFITDMTSHPDYAQGLTTPADFDAVALMASSMTLSTGANPLSSTNIQEVGAAGWVKLELDVAPVAEAQALLLWKD